MKPFSSRFATALVLALTVPAAAQYHGIVAEPIRADDLDRWSHVLALSPEQREAFHGFDRDYRKRHAAFRSHAVAEFQRSHPDYGIASTELSDDVDAAEQAARALNAIQFQLKQLDDSLFDRLAAVLAEDQSLELPRIRDERGRQRYLGGPAQMVYHPALDVDLTATFDAQLEGLPPDERAALEALRTSYATALGTAARAMHESAVDSPVRAAKALRDGRAGETDSSADWALRARIVRETQTVLRDRAGDVGDAHRAFMERAVRQFDPERGEAFRRQCLSRLYPELAAGRGVAEAQIHSLLERDDLPDEVLEMVRAERSAYAASVDRIVNKKCDTLDAKRRSNASHGLKMMLGDGYVYEDPQDYDRAIAKLDERQAQINLDTLDRLQGLLEQHVPGRIALERPERRRRFDDVLAQGLHSIASVSDGRATFGYRHIPISMLRTQFGAGRGVPGPLARAEVERWTRELDLDDASASVVDVLYDDYLDEFARLRASGAVAERHRLRSGLFAQDDDGRPHLPTEADVRRIFAADRAALAAVQALDRSLFESLSAALGEALPAVRRARFEGERQRALYLALEPPEPYELFVFGDARTRLAGEREHANVDVARIVAALELDPATRMGLDETIMAYESAVTSVFASAYEAVRRLDEERAILLARHIRFDEEDGLVAEGMEAPAGLTDAAAEVHDAMARALELNRDLRARVEAALPVTARAGFVVAYQRAAWPGVFRDSGAVHDDLDAILAFDDLTLEQRREIGELALRYRSEYARLCEMLIEDNDQVVRSTRRDLNDDARHTLERVLTPDQWARVAPERFSGGDH